MKLAYWTHLFCVCTLMLHPSLMKISLAASATPVEDFMKEFRNQSRKIQGGAIAILKEDQVIQKYTFGHTRGKTGEITSSTLFPLASSSKPVSAAWVAHLVKENKLTYDGNLREAFPKMDPRIKLGHLLSHTSGYSDKTGNQSIESGKNRIEILESALQSPVVFVPGQHYSYSNVMFSLLEEMILTKTHISFEKGMRDFLAKIDVINPGICTLQPGQPVAYPHSLFGKSKKLRARELPPYYPRTACSAAGVYFSIDQLAQFAKLMMGYYPTVLNKSEIATLHEPRTSAGEILTHWPIHWPYPPTDLTSQYGYGWRILTHKKFPEKRLIFHSGFINGVRSFIGLMPESHYSIVIVTNQDSYFALENGLDFWKRITEENQTSTLTK